MPELSAEKKLQQFERFSKFEKITSNTFELEITQLEVMQSCSYEFVYSDTVNLKPKKKCIRIFADFIKFHSLNFLRLMKIISKNIQQKFDELYCNCLDIGFDIKPLQIDIDCLYEGTINNMIDSKYYMLTSYYFINHDVHLILLMLKWINKIVYLLKNYYDKRYKFDHCEHLFENTTYLLVTTIGQIPICNKCYDDIQKIFFNTDCICIKKFTRIELKPIEKFYKLKLISPSDAY